ncbi:PD-(D/E)XK nuclease family protein [Spirulina sp. CS-785/01]|uniref:PD-(D/E)XK nuclease family protein n=1 Tax=Spirulina sp. CS-785/01 TaxID=3021716 RepID=UPI00232C849E|nr:PD-(D/E)XK nuclease family protein [Spirulina sp. CS-785/01]MDB9312503.1 PD-(D/E)XK nuclease family protein [Spirulina sp. CS-785/01]
MSKQKRISQGQLNTFETCPRKYQHIYLDQLASPVTPYQQERLMWGSQFHLLMQQRELGLPIADLVGEDQKLVQSLTSLLAAAPESLIPQPGTWRDAEHHRTLVWGDYLLTVVYDLLIASPESAQILDWKTYLRPKGRQILADHWQTRLYLFVLGETSDYYPEQLSLTYWFVLGEKDPQSVSFPYDQGQHEQTRQDLAVLLQQMTEFGEHYQQDRIPFPQIPESQGICPTCPFAKRCQRSSEDKESKNFAEEVVSFDKIKEIPL